MHVETLADKSKLSGIRKQIRSELSSIGAPAASAFDCLVAVTEACTNALLHGAGDPGSQDPEVSWVIDQKCARFTIRDYSNSEGNETSRDTDKVAESGEGPDDDPPRDGGYGLSMMRKLMDNVDIQFSPGGTTVSMEKSFE